jgi:hypothetical protein
VAYAFVFIVVLVVSFALAIIQPREKTGKKGPSWSDVGSQFRQYLYDLFKSKRKKLQ